MSADLLVTGGTIVTLDESGRVLDGGALSIRDGAVDEVVGAPGAAALAARHTKTPAIDARGCVILPGFVNAHLHLYSAFARGITVPGAPPRNFVEILEKLWWRLDRVLTDEDVYYSALVGAIESAKAGTTTLIDHHASPHACPGSLTLIHDALDTVGLRGVLAYEVSDRDGRAAEGIEENARFIARVREKRDGRFGALFGLHASFTLGDTTLAQAREAGSALGAPFHVHVGEDLHDLARARATSGKSAVRRLADAGVLTPGSIAAHCLYLDDDDYRILAEHDVVVAHCPQSNANNAVGTGDLARWLDHGLRVALGTDGFTMSIPHEAGAGAILHRLSRRDPACAMGEMITMATRTNAQVAASALGGRFGALTPGAAGDLAIFRYAPTTPLATGTFGGHLLFGLARAPVAATVVGGRVVARDGRLTGIDEDAIFAKSRELAAALWKRFAA
ncbi:MAG: putative aminohydrolase SsnA [bacterium]